MDFTFTEDQLLFQQSVREFLINEVTPAILRASWETDTGRSDEMWVKLIELGLTGLTVPEEFGGLGLSELDFVLLAQECGYVALNEPLVHVVMVATPLLNSLNNDELKQAWLPKIAIGGAKVVVGLTENVFIEDAHIADLLLLQHDNEIHALTQSQVTLRANESVDPCRKLFVVDWTPSAETCVANGAEASALITATMNRGALACAAQALGLTQRMLDMTVQYTSDRQQFGKPIGSFQAVKHSMANVAVRWEYAKAVVYRAAFAIANKQNVAEEASSHAKLAACEASDLATKNCIQAHGAMGYTWEVDLHIFMKRAWAFNNAWGDKAFHKQRVADIIFATDAKLGAGNTFGA
jgi:alkylation response protein AidB-like acyl-CoA dehydrogenase